MIEITAWAPDMDAALDFLEDVSVARRPTPAEIEQGYPAHIPVPIADVNLDGFRDLIDVKKPTGNMIEDAMGNLVPETVAVPGFHWNMKFHSGSAATLTKPTPEGGWLPEHDIFDRTYINELVAGRTGQIPGWVASADDPVPPGYAVNSVRAYDHALIATRRRVWA